MNQLLNMFYIVLRNVTVYVYAYYIASLIEKNISVNFVENISKHINF